MKYSSKTKAFVVKPVRSRLEAIQKLQQKDVEALQEWLIFQACFA